jgi:molybdopterin-guanine dinucleotide biosynthesis protein A
MTFVAGVVLAGGLSSRMGTDKSQLIINNQTLLERTKNLIFNSGIESVFVSGSQEIKDRVSKIGPLGGIITCLEHLTNYTHILFIPVDMPLLETTMIKKIIKGMRLDLSHLENHKFPFIIKNTTKIRNLINKQISNNELSLYQLFKQLEITIIEHGFKQDYFLNTNSPQQWQKAKTQLLLREQ